MNQTPSTPTTLTDIDIPFGRLVAIILKTMIAAIPAIVVFYVILFFFFLIAFAIFGGSAALLQHSMVR